MLPILIALTLLLALAGSGLLLAARARRRAAGLPAGALRYSDTGAKGHSPQPLYAERYGLSGRPDYLLQNGKQVIPVEIKTGHAPPAPYHSHVLQLGAYCLLVEETYGRPAYGVIRYPERAFRVEYTPELRAEVLQTLDAMRAMLDQTTPPQFPERRAACRHCGYREDCLSYGRT